MTCRASPIIFILLVLDMFAFSFNPKDEIVLTDDYGIVPKEIVAREKEMIVPECWTFHEGCPTRYWQCVELIEVEMFCEPEGELEPNERAYTPVLHINDEQVKLEFATRRPWGLQKCESDLKTWTGLLDGEKIACFGAIYGGVDFGIKSNGLRPTQYWLLDFMSSKRGDWSYF